MAYDRYDNDENSRWQRDSSERRDSDRDWNPGRERGQRGSVNRDERGFFERAGDEIASWFGDDDADSRRYDRSDDRRGMRSDYQGDDRFASRGRDETGRRSREIFERGQVGRHNDREQPWGRDRDFAPREQSSLRGSDYQPMTGNYGWSRQPDRSFERDDLRNRMSGRDTAYRNSEPAFDPQYGAWRDRHLGELDRDYDDYRRENQQRFEDDFRGWREQRQAKRGLLGQVREHMEVVGSDDEQVGTVDHVAGDRLILAKSDPDSGGAHHSLSCSDIDRVEGQRVILGCDASQAKTRWRDENRSRALFEREDQGDMGPHILDRSFQGTYR